MIEGEQCAEGDEQLIQCVPNFSEGRDSKTLEDIADVIRSRPVRLIDWSADFDHHRSVFTFVGSPDNVLDAALAAARQALHSIDLRKQAGVHPRFGAMDVLPFVPLKNITLEKCASIAKVAAFAIADELSIPVFLYDNASEAFTPLPAIRKCAFSLLKPDAGPMTPHETAGAVAVGARGPLVAFNVNLDGGTLATARSLAAGIRTNFMGSVRALGLALPSRGIYQVSMNIVKPEQVGMVELVEFIGARASILETELIGAMPGFAAFSALSSSLKLRELRPGQVLLDSWPR